MVPNLHTILMRGYILRRNIINIALLLLLTLGSAFATEPIKSYTVEQVPNVQLADRNNLVSNPDGILSPEAVGRINSTLNSLRNSTSVEVAVVAISSIGDDTPENFAVKLFEKWGIGQKGEDNGLLILLISGDRYITFEVGYGLEGVLTDAITRRIRDNVMVPYFANNNWSDGMVAGVEATNEYLLSQLDPNSAPAQEMQEMQRRGDRNFLIMMGLMVVAVFGIAIYSMVASRRERRCPKCGKTMRIEGENSALIERNVRLITTQYRCPNCGNRMARNRRENISSGGGFGGMMGGGMMGGGMGRGFGGGGFGGGGFGGGGFGGGRSGGGGGTSRF